MLKILMKLRFQALMSRMLIGRGKKQSSGMGKMLLMAVLWIYVFGVFAAMFYMVFSTLAPALHEMGLDWFYFAMMLTMAFALMFVFSVFTAKAQLFEAKDNELLLSLPIAPGTILASRMLGLVMNNLGFELLVALPAAAAWFISFPLSFGAVLSLVTVLICLPLFSTALSALFGWLLALAGTRFRRKTLMSTLMSLAFLVAYFYIYSNINSILSGLLNNAEDIAQAFSAALPIYWLAGGIAFADPACLLPGLACLVLPFVLCCRILARSFVRTATAQRGFAKVKYVERRARRASPFAALFRREAARLLSSSTYIMNSAIGAFMSLIGAVVLLIKGPELLAMLTPVLGEELSELIILPVVAMLCALSSMISITACSVSLEGDMLWIVRSMPVSTLDVLKAKLALHLSLSVPGTLVLQAVLCILLRPQALSLLWLLLIPQLFGLVMALLGLWANLCHPKLDWISETQAVKQSFSVMIAIFGGWGLLLPPVVAGIFLLRSPMGAVLLPCAFLLLLAAAAFIFWRWLKKRGCAIFESL